MENVKQVLLNEIPEFKKSGEAFLEGTLSKMDFKKVSGGFGAYAHRDGKSFMIRLRILSGVLSKTQLRTVQVLAEKYAVPIVHLTTRQAIQFHGLSLEGVCNVMEEAMAHNIYTRGAGGNYPRNVAMSPLSGLEEGEVFDVLPYAMAANAYFLKRIYTYHLPRKLKVSFTSEKEDAAHSTIQDLGFVATLKDNKPYFQLYLGGGLGRQSRTASPYPQLLPAEDILYALEAMVSLFVAEGDYKNHQKSRVRCIVERMGEEAFFNCFKEHLEAAYQKEGLDFKPVVPQYKKEGIEVDFKHIAVKPQKQKGLYSYYFHPIGGQMDRKLFGKIVDVIEPMEEVYGRLAMSEGIYLVNLNGEEVQKVAQVLDADNALIGVEKTRSCIGTPICQVGVLESQKTLKDIVNYFKEKNYTKETLPSIYISGCTNSCGVHQIGGIGLTGKKKKIQGELTGVYDVFIAGRCGIGKTQLGEPLGEIVESKVAQWLYELACEIDKSGLDFYDYMEKHQETAKALLEKYNA